MNGSIIPEKRINIFCGHYGSGKTSVAVSFAEHIAAAGLPVAVADMDIVNPYFRTKDYADELRKKGIRVIVSDYANTNVDMPALPSEMYSIFSYPEEKIIIDLGGDDRGALALGRWRDGIVSSGDYDMFFVVNGRRPLTSTVADCTEVLREIENSAGIKATAIINNTNLGDETDEEVLLKGAEFARGLSLASGLPVYCNAADTRLYGKIREKVERPFPVARR